MTKSELIARLAWRVEYLEHKLLEIEDLASTCNHECDHRKYLIEIANLCSSGELYDDID